jgi:hypothetical protein
MFEDLRLKLYQYSKGISFDEPSHIYYYKNRTMTSVTTAVSNCFPRFDRSGAICQNLSEVRGISVKQLKAEWRNKAKLGTHVHEAGECLVSGVVPPTLPESMPVEDVDFVTNCFISLQEFYYNLKDTKVLFPEFIVYNGQYSVAGTVDLLVFNELTGKIDIYDWKTNSSITSAQVNYGKYGFGRLAKLPDTNFYHYALQLSIYKYILEKSGFDVGELYLVHLTETGATQIKVPYLSDEALVVLEDNL